MEKDDGDYDDDNKEEEGKMKLWLSCRDEDYERADRRQGWQHLKGRRVGMGVVIVGVRSGNYLGESEGVGHGADKDLTQLPIEVRALDPVKVGIHPKDPGKRKVRSWSGQGVLTPLFDHFPQYSVNSHYMSCPIFLPLLL